MARIAGIDLPKTKRIEIALTYIYGIGRSSSRKILTEAGLGFDRKAGELDDDELQQLRVIIDNKYRIEGDLRREILGNIKRLMDLGCYRGLRHRRGLPVRDFNSTGAVALRDLLEAEAVPIPWPNAKLLEKILISRREEKLASKIWQGS